MSSREDLFAPKNPKFDQAVRRLVLSMPAAQLLGFEFTRIEPGFVELVQPYRRELAYKDGFFQASIVGAVADFAGAPAAMTLLDEGWMAATLDFTVKILASTQGDRLIARARVVRPGQTITVTSVDVYAAHAEKETLCACALLSTRNVSLAR
jgi:uncharacterized protein (TIGR00369 family)